jgi:nucleotide-binding universal stress UspA family protein
MMMKTGSERINSLDGESVRSSSLLTQREPDFLAGPVMGDPESPSFVEIGPKEELRVPCCSRWRHILVPMTLDDASMAALEFASVLARRSSSELALLYIFQPAASMGALRTEVELWRHFSRIRARHPIVRLFLNSGRSCEQVVAAAKRMSADLIVMSSDYYWQFLSYLAQAENERSQVQLFPCPVVLVKGAVYRDNSPARLDAAA